MKGLALFKNALNNSTSNEHNQNISIKITHVKRDNNNYNCLSNNKINSLETSLPEENTNLEFSDYYNNFKKFGINFYNIGNLYGFCYFKKKNILLFCVDKKWHLYLIIYFIELMFYIFADYFLYNKLEKWKQNIFHILLILFFIFFSVAVFVNPGVILKNQQRDKFGYFCTKCNIFYGNKEKITHCYSCDVCVERIDHHCGVLRKCVAKNNFYTFFVMIWCCVGLYTFTLLNIILYATKYYSEIKKKKKK